MQKETYGRKGEAVVQKNYAAIDRGSEGLREIKVDKEWLKLKPVKEVALTGDKYFDEFVTPIENLEGYDLPTSTFTKHGLLDGSMRNDVTFKSKRRIADFVPIWKSENCIQCNTCSFVCPHGTIRPFLLTAEEVEKLPEAAKKMLFLQWVLAYKAISSVFKLVLLTV